MAEMGSEYIHNHKKIVPREIRIIVRLLHNRHCYWKHYEELVGNEIQIFGLYHKKLPALRN